MGICELLTIIFVILKATGLITWSWWLVFAPMYPALVIYAVVVFIWLTMGAAVIYDWFKWR